MIRVDAPVDAGRNRAVTHTAEKRPEAPVDGGFAALLAVMMGPLSQASGITGQVPLPQANQQATAEATTVSQASHEISLPVVPVPDRTARSAAALPIEPPVQGPDAEPGWDTALGDSPKQARLLADRPAEAKAESGAEAALKIPVPEGGPLEPAPRASVPEVVQQLRIHFGFISNEEASSGASPPHAMDLAGEISEGALSLPVETPPAGERAGEPFVPAEAARDASADGTQETVGVGGVDVAAGHEVAQPPIGNAQENDGQRPAADAGSRRVPKDADSAESAFPSGLWWPVSTGDSSETVSTSPTFQEPDAPPSPMRNRYLTEKPVSTDQVMDLVVESLRDKPDGEYAITLRLHPEHLGEVRLQVQVAGREVQTRFEVATPEARQLLEQRSEQLRDGLQNAGFTLSGFAVSTGGGSRQNWERWEVEEWLWQGRQEVPAVKSRSAASSVRRVAQGKHTGILDRLA